MHAYYAQSQYNKKPDHLAQKIGVYITYQQPGAENSVEAYKEQTKPPRTTEFTRKKV